MSELIERLEGLTEPCRDLDCMIALEIGCVLEKRGKDRQEWYYRPDGGRWNNSHFAYGYDAVPKYTRSIDAAMTLVPAGSDWACGTLDESTGLAWAWAKNFDFEASASTPAVALCIAALMARNAA